MKNIRFNKNSLLLSIFLINSKIICISEHKELKAILNDENTPDNLYQEFEDDKINQDYNEDQQISTENKLKSIIPNESNRNLKHQNQYIGFIPKNNEIKNEIDSKSDDIQSEYNDEESDSEYLVKQNLKKNYHYNDKFKRNNSKLNLSSKNRLSNFIYIIIDIIEYFIIQIALLIRPIIYLIWGLPGDILKNFYCLLDQYYIITSLILLILGYIILENTILRFFLYHIIIRPILWFPTTIKIIFRFLRFSIITIQKEGMDSILIIVTNIYFNFVREFKRLRKISPSKCKERGDIIKITNIATKENINKNLNQCNLSKINYNENLHTRIYKNEIIPKSVIIDNNRNKFRREIHQKNKSKRNCCK